MRPLYSYLVLTGTSTFTMVKDWELYLTVQTKQGLTSMTNPCRDKSQNNTASMKAQKIY